MIRLFSAIVVALLMGVLFTLTIGCANIIPPAGGPKDTIPPVLVNAIPADSATNFTANRITLNFNEFIDLQNTFENVLVSPIPRNVPNISSNFRTVSIKLKDTLEPNTTYTINFGNALRDINEGNIAKNFSYVFSTGASIDQNTVTGKVVMAQTGKIDSTIIVVLHKNKYDSAVALEKPRYYARLDGKGIFTFSNLPKGVFSIYAIPNNYSKQYEDSTKPFAFADSAVNTTENKPILLYAYSRVKKDTINKTKQSGTKDNDKDNKPFKLLMSVQGNKHDIFQKLDLSFTKRFLLIDSSKVKLTDTNFNPIKGYTLVADTVKNLVTLNFNWPPGKYYKLIVDSTAFNDVTGKRLISNDTINFSTKSAEEYGSLKLRFTNLDLSKNPVLQIVLNEQLVESAPLKEKEYYKKYMLPGEYELRLLYDSNKNGMWDPGMFFGIHQQPEVVVPINEKLSIRANWDNERNITF